MPDAPLNPAPRDPAAQPDQHRHRSEINQQWLAALDKHEAIGKAALQDAYLPTLIALPEGHVFDPEIDLSAANIQQFLLDCGHARTDLTAALGGTHGVGEASDEEQAAEEGLIEAIRPIQARVRQKYAGKNAGALKDYHIGNRLEGNRSQLQQYTEDILTKLKTDRLPGIGTPQIGALQAALAAWLKTQGEGTTAQSTATGKRGSVKDQLAALMRFRLRLQYAADALWPFFKPANAGLRGEFRLTANRPFDG